MSEEKTLKDLNDFKNYSYLCPQENEFIPLTLT